MISKSKYLKFIKCPKILWQDKFAPQRAGERGAQKFGAFQDIRPLALQMFEVEEGSLSKKSASFYNKDLGVSCHADFLKSNEDGSFDLYLIKQTVRVKEEYLHEIAFNRFVLNSLGIEVKNCFIVHLNSDYIKNGELDKAELFLTRNITENLEDLSQNICESIKGAHEVLKEKQEPHMNIHEKCHGSRVCRYVNHCWAHIPNPSVFDIYDLKKKLDYYKKGIVSFADLKANDIPLTEMQVRQVDFYLEDKKPYIDNEGIKTFLNSLNYPLYFLDFETFQTQIPIFDNTKPNQRIPFQYSLHILKGKAKARVAHKEFLAKESRLQIRELAERLVKDIKDDNGSIICYGSDFERACINKMAEQFPDLAPRLKSIASRLVDLLSVFHNGYVYNKEMGGSFSLKSVLPALFPNHQTLNYHALEAVQSGEDAPAVFLSLKTLSPKQRKKMRKNLKAYCKLDTLGMVEIYFYLLSV
ncbi:MAG: DUF2779 domain-containing protein [Firmicutes bacterium]|nr:DUF2779 domain-containing protein [Bacillota bacterium]